jgi:3-oxoacyl-[acyl-carrier-protein] synthase-1
MTRATIVWPGSALNQDGFLDTARALRDRYGADRVALVLGTSTSSIGETETAYRHLDADGRFAPEQRRAVCTSRTRSVCSCRTSSGSTVPA